MKSKFTILALMLILSCSIRADIPEKLSNCVNKLMPMYQGNCISDYAVVATTAVELGWCATNSTKYSDIRFSSQDIICNCKECHNVKGNGCMGGQIKKALDYIKNGKNVGGTYLEGAVTTATIDSNGPQGYKNCLKYWTKICDPTEETCPTFNPKDVAVCPDISNAETKCTADTTVKYSEAKVTKAINKNVVSLSTTDSIKIAINNNHPVIASMEIFEDMEFYLGSEKIYVHKNGQSLGVVYVLIIGSGTDSKTKKKYWDILVPWDIKYNASSKIGG